MYTQLRRYRHIVTEEGKQFDTIFTKKKTIILREIKSIYIYKCMYICSLLLGIIGHIWPEHCSNIIPNLSARDHISYSDKIYVLGISTIIVI